MRIVTLVPSATEIVAALGGEASIVGISHACDFPPGIAGRPVLTAPRLSLDVSSRAIDEAVRVAAEDGQPIYRLDEARLAALAPDLVVTQGQCALCAVSDADLAPLLAALDRPPAVVSLAGESMPEVFADIDEVARAMAVPARGAALIDEMRARMTAIGETAGALGARPRVLFLDWLDPPLAGGAYLPDLVALAGGAPVLAEPGGGYPPLGLDAIAAARPDLVFAAPCGLGIARAEAELRPLLMGLAALGFSPPAVAADGNHWFNRPGPRLAESLEILAEALHPARFPFGWEGRAFVRV